MLFVIMSNGEMISSGRSLFVVVAVAAAAVAIRQGRIIN
jgi:hypothetical protein